MAGSPVTLGCKNMASKHGNKIIGPYIQIEKALLQSPEFRGLSSKAVKVYLLIAEKQNGRNASNLSLTYSEVKDHMASATFAKALKELKDKEIIHVMRPGGLEKGCTIYSIANKWWRRKVPRGEKFQP